MFSENLPQLWKLNLVIEWRHPTYLISVTVFCLRLGAKQKYIFPDLALRMKNLFEYDLSTFVDYALLTSALARSIFDQSAEIFRAARSSKRECSTTCLKKRIGAIKFRCGRVTLIIRVGGIVPDQNHFTYSLFSSLTRLIMCSSAQDLKQRAKWDGAAGSSRTQLLTSLQSATVASS